MREISCKQITLKLSEAILRAEYNIDPKLRALVSEKSKSEKKPLAAKVLSQLVQNYDIAHSEQIAICQDTGMCIVFVRFGQDVHVTGGSFEDAINGAVRDAYKGLRKSVVYDPLYDRKNTLDNTPAIIHTQIVPGEKLDFTVVCKGFGSENMSRIKMLAPSAGEKGIVDFVTETARLAGANPCPPIIMGVCIGGDFEQSALYAKRMTAMGMDYHPEDERYRALEETLTNQINSLSIGPAGFGGETTLLKLNLCCLPTHIASLPCAVNVCCHASRHASFTI